MAEVSPSSLRAPRSKPVPGPVRALLAFGSAARQSAEAVLRECRELGQRNGAAIGVSELRQTPADAAGAYREARDAATIARALLGDGGAIAYSQVGAYRYLVQIAADDAPRDRMRAAVDLLIAYDRKRRTALLDTLERYLSERRSVIESARALYIHPNTLRQRLGADRGADRPPARRGRPALAGAGDQAGPAARPAERPGLRGFHKLRNLATTAAFPRSHIVNHGRGSSGGHEGGTGTRPRRRSISDPHVPAAAGRADQWPETRGYSTRRRHQETGSLARRRTRWGSWDHSRSPTIRLRSGSAAITIASQRSLAASSRMRRVDLRVPST